MGDLKKTCTVIGNNKNNNNNNNKIIIIMIIPAFRLDGQKSQTHSFFNKEVIVMITKKWNYHN